MLVCKTSKMTIELESSGECGKILHESVQVSNSCLSIAMLFALQHKRNHCQNVNSLSQIRQHSLTVSPLW